MTMRYRGCVITVEHSTILYLASFGLKGESVTSAHNDEQSFLSNIIGDSESFDSLQHIFGHFLFDSIETVVLPSKWFTISVLRTLKNTNLETLTE